MTAIFLRFPGFFWIFSEVLLSEQLSEQYCLIIKHQWKKFKAGNTGNGSTVQYNPYNKQNIIIKSVSGKTKKIWFQKIWPVLSFKIESISVLYKAQDALLNQFWKESSLVLKIGFFLYLVQTKKKWLKPTKKSKMGLHPCIVFSWISSVLFFYGILNFNENISSEKYYQLDTLYLFLLKKNYLHQSVGKSLLLLYEKAKCPQEWIQALKCGRFTSFNLLFHSYFIKLSPFSVNTTYETLKQKRDLLPPKLFFNIQGINNCPIWWDLYLII